MKEGKGNLLTDLLFTGWFAAVLGGGENDLWCVAVMMGLVWSCCLKVLSKQDG